MKESPFKSCKFLVILGAVFLFWLWDYSQTLLSHSTASMSVLGDDILPSNWDKRREAYGKMILDRKNAIYSLVEIVREKKEKADTGKWFPSQGDQLWYAIRLLGDLRASEGVEPLLDVIDIQFERVSTPGGPKDGVVIQSLVTIGKPASKKSLEYLGNDKSKERAKMYVRVIAVVEGIDLGREMVRLAAEREKDPAKYARLQRALELFKEGDRPIP